MSDVYVHPFLRHDEHDVLDRVLDVAAQVRSDHDPVQWLAVLVDQMGLLSRAALSRDAELLDCAVSVVAGTAVAMADCAQRNGWSMS